MGDLFGAGDALAITQGGGVYGGGVDLAVPDDPGKAFWEAWFPGHPRKVARKQVIAKVAKILKTEEADWGQLFGGLQRYIASKPDPKFIPLPMTWLNQNRWEANYQPPEPPKRTLAAMMRGE